MNLVTYYLHPVVCCTVVQETETRKVSCSELVMWDHSMTLTSPLFVLAGVPRMALSAGRRDCLSAGDTCSSDDTCSPRLRTLRQCVAGDGSVKLGPGARNQCENAMTALLSTPLHGCQCKRGMKKEKNCLSIYWSLHQSVLHGKTGINTVSDASQGSRLTFFITAPEPSQKKNLTIPK